MLFEDMCMMVPVQSGPGFHMNSIAGRLCWQILGFSRPCEYVGTRIALCYRDNTTDQTIQYLNPSRINRFFCSKNRAQFRGLSSLQFSGYHGVKLGIYLHLMLQLRMSGPLFSIMHIHCVHRESCTFFISLPVNNEYDQVPEI